VTNDLNAGRLADRLKEAVQNAVADEVRDIVAQEVKRAFHEHESQLTSLIQTTVAQAIAELAPLENRVADLERRMTMSPELVKALTEYVKDRP
jgi:hypothetical protein